MSHHLESWATIREKYKDTWVAMTEWKEDTHGDILSGHVAYCHPSQHAFYLYLTQHFPRTDLAVRYTGKVRVPLLFGAAIEGA